MLKLILVTCALSGTIILPALAQDTTNPIGGENIPGMVQPDMGDHTDNSVMPSSQEDLIQQKSSPQGDEDITKQPPEKKKATPSIVEEETYKGRVL